MKKVKIAPSIIAANQLRLEEEIKAIENAGADIIHIDVMDGVFVPNITIGQGVTSYIKNITNLPLECHLMIVEPHKHIRSFIEAGAKMISVHFEIAPNIHRTISMIKDKGVMAGIAINPSTSPSQLLYLVEECDFILVMSVHPGFYGQKIIPKTLEKIGYFKRLFEKFDRPPLIEIDGGIDKKWAKEARKFGCDIIVSGAYIFKSNDYKKAIDSLKNK